MLKIIECPCCKNEGLKIEVQNGYKCVTSGKPFKQMTCKTLCEVCKRIIKYDIVKDKE